jgi:cellulose synthase/poly-beta-1,6-N-acetylglucosamine synthase-like glycosyltransferase
MIDKLLTLSIVIPAYNEERYISVCLDAIANQTVMPDEVIVIDNNSSDKTCEIAGKYSFVTVLHEDRQHQAFAQAKGFSQARGDIVARIDADTILHPNWVENAKKYFANHPKSVAITGPGSFYDVPLKSVAETFFHFYHSKVASRIAGHVMLWGANCAFRRSALDKVKQNLAQRADIWEDYDLSFALAGFGSIDYRKDIIAGCSLRSAHKKVSQLLSYQIRGIRTFKLHVSKWRLGLFTLAWSTMVAFIPLALLGQLILRIAQASHSERFNPAYPITQELPEST